MTFPRTTDMDTILDRVEQKIDKLGERVTSIDVTLARNTVSLEEHMRRTALLEQDVKPLKARAMLEVAIVKVMFALGALAVFLHRMGVL